MYQQKICYVDLYKNGLKCGNMGHVKLEWEDDRYRFQTGLCRLEKQTLVTLHLRRGETDTADSDTLLSGGMPFEETEGTSEKLADIAIVHGKGSYRSDWIPLWGDEQQMIFAASGGIYGSCLLPQMKKMQPDKAPVDHIEPENIEKVHQENLDKEISEAAADVTEPLEIRNIEKPAEVKKDNGKSAKIMEFSEFLAAKAEERQKNGQLYREMTLPANVSKEAQSEIKPPIFWPVRTAADIDSKPRPVHNVETAQGIDKKVEAKLAENKWEQLCSMYETVRPIAGDITFIKIRPEDFVILRQEYQKLVRNSFLLHGYYSYRYLLLGKYPDKYYLGVPGIMHEQEKMAAAMFGFVGFERALPQDGQNNDGMTFGYYMMEVAI